jgi:hypothetical protein
MDLGLSDTVVLVTGAEQRLGRAIGLAFAAERAHVVFHYHSSGDGAESAAKEARALGVQRRGARAGADRRARHEPMTDERMKRIVAQYPLGRVGRADDVTPMVLLLAAML